MSAKTDVLFSAFRMGNLHLKNRVVMAPMTRNFCPDNVPTPEVVDYYRRRAEGGAGLIITEGTYVPHPSAAGYPRVPFFFGDEALAGWRQVVDAVHASGTKIFPQLWHTGSFRREHLGPQVGLPAWTPSGVANPQVKHSQPLHVMSESDIAEVIAAFAQAACDAERIGFDGIEIHGAHGYLLDEFLWVQTNQRTDAYGGSLQNRVRFLAELVAAVRRRVSADFPVCLRLSQWKQQDYSARLVQTPAELAELLQPLVDAGVDIFHGSTRRYWEPEFEGSDLNFAGWIRKLTGKPVITVGSVGLDNTSFDTAKVAPIESLLERLARDEFDLVAVGRALLADAAWANKVREGRLDAIMPFDGSLHVQQLN